MEHRRADRIADLMLQELADVLLRKVKDPRLVGVTFTDVKLSADLRHARVFYSVMAADDVRAAVAAGLESARGFVKRELGKRLQLRYIPDIVFCFDTSLEYGSRIQSLLNEVKKTERP
jgi:ribosome-binding factor A